jgi:hypothetical protein
MSLRFEYGVSRIQDFEVTGGADRCAKTGVAEMSLDGEPVRTTKRFWNSLHQRFGFTSNVFRYFTPREVFDRISNVAPNDRVRWCLERGKDGRGTLQAVTNPSTALMPHDELVGLLKRFGAGDVRYSNGVVRSIHRPRADGTFDVAGDGFQNKFVLETPVDGFGRPAVYLSLLRLICSNGAIGYSPAFRSELSVGRGNDGVAFALTRVLEGFNNEDGYAALRQRFESAAKSWASVHEANRLYKLLARLHNQGHVAARGRPTGGDVAREQSGPLFAAFHKMTGDLTRIYGLANLDAISAKRQRTLPTAARVYDLLNFASELATHHASEAGGRQVQAFIGDLISGEYDLEGTVDRFGDWRDFFFADEDAADSLAGLSRRRRR